LAVGAGATKGRKAQVMQSAISKPYNKSLSFYSFGGSGGSSISFFWQQSHWTDRFLSGE
jgi:hypothetical protein